jgi:hypothetical protein|tara:strand:+ start:1072 stop:1413 length:342 start_codon:yes stop_codon:yes gene_type:complete
MFLVRLLYIKKMGKYVYKILTLVIYKCINHFEIILGGVEMARKTRLMQQVEERYRQPLERLLPEMINENGLSATAAELEVSKATLGYWLLKLGINVRRVALAPGETLEVKRAS